MEAENPEADHSQADGPVGCAEEEGKGFQDQGARTSAWEGVPSWQVLGRELEQGYAQHTHAQRVIDEWLESLTHPPFLDTPYSSGEDTDEGLYELAIEPQSALSDNPSPYEVTDLESEGDNVVAYDTETSHHMTIADRHWLRRKQWLRHKGHECRCQKDCWARGSSLPLFKNSSKEGATMYIDWRNSVNELIADKLDEKQIRSLVLQFLEGPPKDTAHLAYKNGKGSLKDILRALDKLYGHSASYIHLQLEMCNIQQTYKESAQDYYERLVRLEVAIQDKYPEHLYDLELERTAQEAFYDGLWEEYKPMVVHMLESPNVTVRDLVEVVWKIEAMNEWQCLQWINATQYPPSMSSTYNKPTYDKDKNHNKDKKDHKDKHNGRSGGVIKANPQHMELEVELHSLDKDAEAAHATDDDALWRDCCAVQQAEEAEHFSGVCYNCKKAGHAWRHCTEPLRPALQ